MKRFRSPTAKAGELLAKYGKHEGELDIFYCYQSPSAKCDSRMLSSAFECAKIMDNKTLREILVERGYDITTLRFSIKKKDAPDAEV